MRIKIDLSNNPYWAGRVADRPQNKGIFYFEILILNLNTWTMRGRIYPSEDSLNAMYKNVDIGMGHIVDKALLINLQDDEDNLPYTNELVYVIKVGDKYISRDATQTNKNHASYSTLLDAMVWKKRGMAQNWLDSDNYGLVKGLDAEVMGVKRHVYMTEI